MTACPPWNGGPAVLAETGTMTSCSVPSHVNGGAGCPAEKTPPNRNPEPDAMSLPDACWTETDAPAETRVWGGSNGVQETTTGTRMAPRPTSVGSPIRIVMASAGDAANAAALTTPATPSHRWILVGMRPPSRGDRTAGNGRPNRSESRFTRAVRADAER